MAARFYGLDQMAEVYVSPARFFGTDYAASWTAELARLGYPDVQSFPYIYPPLWAALLSPLATRFDPMTFFTGVYVIHIAMLAVMPVLAYRLMRPAMSFAPFALLSVALLATSVIPAHALFHNQPQITVSFLILAGFERLSARRPVMAGVLLGLAAALKLSPLVLILIFLAERQYRAAAACLITAGALALASLAVAGPDLHRVFLDKIALLGDQLVIWDLNISLRAALLQLSEAIAGRPWPAGTTAIPLLLKMPAWAGPVAGLIFAAGAAWAYAATRHSALPARLGHRLAALMLILTLTAPLGWAHHYLVPLALLPGLYGALKPVPALLIIGAAGILFSSAATPYLGTAFGPLNLATPISVAAMLGLYLVFLLSARNTAPNTARNSPR